MFPLFTHSSFPSVCVCVSFFPSPTHSSFPSVFIGENKKKKNPPFSPRTCALFNHTPRSLVCVFLLKTVSSSLLSVSFAPHTPRDLFSTPVQQHTRNKARARFSRYSSPPKLQARFSRFPTFEAEKGFYPNSHPQKEKSKVFPQLHTPKKIKARFSRFSTGSTVEKGVTPT